MEEIGPSLGECYFDRNSSAQFTLQFSWKDTDYGSGLGMFVVWVIPEQNWILFIYFFFFLKGHSALLWLMCLQTWRKTSETKRCICFCPSSFSWFPGLALAFHDGSIQILHRLSLHTMGVFYGSSSSSSGQRPVDEPAIKRQRTGGPALHFKALQFSWTSLALAGVDNHGKVRTHTWTLAGSSLWSRFLTCLMTLTTVFYFL